MNKNAYSTIDLSARRSAQMGIKMYQKLQALFCCIFMGAVTALFFVGERRVGVVAFRIQGITVEMIPVQGFCHTS